MNWTRFIIRTQQDIEDMQIRYRRATPQLVGFDTETTGLHIMKDKPFLMIFGYIGARGEREVYTCDLEMNPTIAHSFLDMMYHLCSTAPYVYAWNTKYDLHMLCNYGKPYPHRNLADGQTLVRLTQMADDNTSGITALKSVAKRYVTKDADTDQQLVKEQLKQLRASRTNLLKMALKPHGWTKKQVDDFLKDKTNLVDDLPEEVAEVFRAWQREYPEPTYADIDRPTLTQYGSRDVELMLDFVEKAYPVMVNRGGLKIFEQECRLIPHMLKMERVGFNVDRQYLFDCKEKTRQYLIRKREELCQIVGEPIKVSQSKRIMELYLEKWGITLPSSDEANLNLVMKSEAPDDAKRFAKLIVHLRTVEKWYSTYICGMITKTEFDGRLYTQSNQNGAVSGRFSSDFQQMPKDPLKSEEGEELFYPRRAVKPTGGGWNHIYYFDYSQIELRIQAHYTILISGGDRNLCRAYMPFECYRIVYIEGERVKEQFDYNNPEHLNQWNTGEWKHLEDDKLWEKVDLHSATTQQAFPDLDPTSDEFKRMRKYGKSTNFAKNYGAGKGALINQFHFPEDIAEALDKGYYEAFPKVRDYQEYVAKVSNIRGYVRNLFGRCYYLADQRWSYKLCNYLIQGSGADMLKEKIIQVCEMLEEGGFKTRFQMNIHDELSFEVWEGEEFILPTIKRIMEVAEWSKVPIVADVELTATTWADKEEVDIHDVYDQWYLKTYGESVLF